MYLIQELFRLSLLSLNEIVNICVTDGSEILIEAPKWGTRSYWKYHTYTVTLGGLMYKGEKMKVKILTGALSNPRSLVMRCSEQFLFLL